MPIRFDQYQVRRRDNLADIDFWNKRLQDIDLRLAEREKDGDRINSTVDTLETLALTRLNDTFTPLIVEAQSRLNSLGASFSAESLSSLTIGTGSKLLTLTDATAENYVFTDYVNVRAAADPTNTMLGQVVSFDRPSKLLTLNVVSVTGSGTYADWLIRVGTPPETGHADRTDNPHLVTAAQLGNPAGSAPAYTISQADAAIAAAIAAIPGVDLSSRLEKSLNLSDLPDKAVARTNLELKLLATQDTVGWGQLASNVFATAADVRSKAANKLITAAALWDAAYSVDLSYVSGTITLDMNAGLNYVMTANGNILLANPSNVKVGQSGGIGIWISGAGRTISVGSNWYPINGVAPVFSTANGAANYVSWQCLVPGVIAFTGGKITG